MSRIAWLLLVAVVAPGASSCSSDDKEFSGTCVGRRDWAQTCGVQYNNVPGLCEQVEGCSWTGTFCSGFPVDCRSYEDEASCGVECRWFGPPSCDSEADCIVYWLNNGGCADIENLQADGWFAEDGDGNEVLIRFADYCP